ncbi:hypothetical protein COU80_03795 [Candidatus Peregrinibacteria bacterium CG10_big_fil_rev_8_21_14_0_10_55_24]|nr:MAG: hypothetical protein COU80_03795 [Candidatus Peregrinibacteria bacterium CG10_big_fil_rev_8_21_14_0_10_55_24]
METSLLHVLVFPIGALACCVLLHALALRIFPHVGLLDFPQRYGLTRNRLPYPTGILLIATFLPFFLASEGISPQTMGVVGGIALLGIVSCIDDRTPLPSWLRLAVQVLVALLIFATGSRIYTITNPLEGIAGIGELIKLDTVDIPTAWFGPLPLWSGVFTVLWLGLTINALNWFDGIPGQVSMLSFIGFLTIGFLSLSNRVGQPQLAAIAFLLAAVSLAALLFDFPPARVLMGDTGSMFLGLMLGVLTIYAGGKVATAFLVLGVPLIDSGLVGLRRIAHGRSPLRGSTEGEHLHHLLLARGWTQQSVILLTATLGTFFGVTALFLSTKEKFFAALLLLILIVALRLYARRH